MLAIADACAWQKKVKYSTTYKHSTHRPVK
jgi:hypothetical protein